MVVKDVNQQVTITYLIKTASFRLILRYFLSYCCTIWLLEYFSGSKCIWNDHDFVGGDLWSHSTRNATSCKKKCAAWEKCKKWTFLQSELSGKCYLKKTSHSIPRDFCEGCKTGFRNSVMQKCGLNGKISIVITMNTIILLSRIQYWKFFHNR